MIPTPKELLDRSVFNNEVIRKELIVKLSGELNRRIDIAKGDILDITIQAPGTQRRLATELLQEAGYNVITARNPTHRNESYLEIRIQIPPQSE